MTAVASSFKRSATSRWSSSTWRAIKDIFEDDIRPPTPHELGLDDDDDVNERKLITVAEDRSVCLHQVFVKVVSARGLLAMDTNNLSDPYVIVSLGTRKHMTRVCRKTLEPVFDETFAFEVGSLQGEYVTFTVMDWDLLTSDDFMGMGRVGLEKLKTSEGTPLKTVSVPLMGYKGRGKKAKRVDCGMLEVFVWFGEGVGVVDFGRQMGLRGAPRMLQGGGVSSVEEPYLVCLCLNMLDVFIDGGEDPLSRSPKSPRSLRSQRSMGGRSELSSGRYRDERRRKMVADAMGMGDDEEIYDDLDAGAWQPHNDHEVGSFAYFRCSLGSTTKTSHLVRQQGDVVPINDQVQFLFPVPIPDGQLVLTLYRTNASKAAGVATHVCLVDIHALLADDLRSRPDVDLKVVCKKMTLTLTPLKKNKKNPGMTTLSLSVYLADMDFRRRMAGVPVVGATPALARAGWADPRLAAAVVRQNLMGRLDDDDLLQLETRSDAEYQLYRSNKAAYEQQKQRLEIFVRGAVERQIEKVEKVIGKDVAHARQVLSEAEGARMDVMGMAVDVDPIDGTGEVVQGLESAETGRLTVSLLGISAAEGVSPLPHAAVVFNVEQSWFRTGDLHDVATDETKLEDFAVSLPIVSPGAMLSACLVSKSRKKDSKEVTRGAFIDQGVLRFRLSSIECGKTIAVTLPFLASREKGGRVVGHARLAVKLDFSSLKARMRGFARPEFPQECYVHMIARSPTMPSLQRERREMLTDWLLSMNPPFPSEAVNMIHRVELEAFSLSRLRANLRRIRIALKALRRLKQGFDVLASWKYPNLSRVGLIGAVLTAYYPSVAVSILAAYLATTMWKDVPSDAVPDAMEEDGIGLDLLDRTEKDELRDGVQLQLVGTGVVANLRSRWQGVRGILLMVQSHMDAVASLLERFESLLGWKAPLVSAMLMTVIMVVSVVVMAIGLRPIMAGLLMFTIRPPRMRKPWTPGPISAFLKVPIRGDRWS